jgi:small subunit ribosomal protein S13
MGSKKTKVKEDVVDEKKKDDSKDKKPVFKKKKLIEGVRGMVRITQMDIEGERKLKSALLKIKGVGKSLSKAFISASGLDADAMVGAMTDEQISKIEDVMKNPAKYNIPYYMFNRMSDPQTGEHRHLVSTDLSFTIKSDIDNLKKMRCYKGVRHELGQPVRGQRTRSSFRTGSQVGVVKTKQQPGAAPAGAGGGKPAAGAPAAAAGPAPAAKPAAGAAPAAKPAAKK